MSSCTHFEALAIANCVYHSAQPNANHCLSGSDFHLDALYETCLLMLQVVIPLGSVTWPNRRHEQSVQGKGDGMPSSQRSIGSAQGQTVV